MICSLKYGDFAIYNMTAVRHLEFKEITFGHVTVTEFQICICVQNFINNRMTFP